MPRENDVAEVVVEPREAAGLRGVLAELAAEYTTAENPEFLRAAPGLGQLLPPRVRDALLAMRYEESAAGLVVRGGVPDPTPQPTPSSWESRPAGATMPQDLWLMLLAAQLGDLMSWANLQDGRLINDILPQRGDEDSQTAFGSTAELDFHVEEAIHDERSDGFALLCMRNPDAVPTTLASVASVDLGAIDADVLFQPRFQIGGDDEFRIRPMLFGDPAAPYLRVDGPYTRPVRGDEAAAKALDALLHQLAANLEDVVLHAGDVLLVDNFRAVHGRRPFQARYDGTDRWLRRVSAVRDLRKLRTLRGSADGRVVVPAPVDLGESEETI